MARLVEAPNQAIANMKADYAPVMADTAVAAYRASVAKQGFFLKPYTPEEYEKLKWGLDGDSLPTINDGLNGLLYHQTRIVRAEGLKEKFYLGKAAPAPWGTYGKDGLRKKDAAVDHIEGTGFLAKLEDGASSTIAVADPEGLNKIPQHHLYVVRLSGPPQLRGKISLGRSLGENVDAAREKFGIPAKEVTVVMLRVNEKRKINEQYRDAAIHAGVNLVELDAGDMVPGIVSVMDPKDHDMGVVLGYGRSGLDETMEDCVAGVLTGGVVDTREYNHDNHEETNSNPVRPVEFMVPGKPEGLMGIVTPITKDKWLKVPALQIREDGSGLSHTWTITADGIEIIPREHPAVAA